MHFSYPVVYVCVDHVSLVTFLASPQTIRHLSFTGLPLFGHLQCTVATSFERHCILHPLTCYFKLTRQSSPCCELPEQFMRIEGGSVHPSGVPRPRMSFVQCAHSLTHTHPPTHSLTLSNTYSLSQGCVPAQCGFQDSYFRVYLVDLPPYPRQCFSWHLDLFGLVNHQTQFHFSLNPLHIVGVFCRFVTGHC
ncbi:hypothetical protein CRM22_010590 [Opisthorchis felineus]|uniref:Uncharacterized protein n=1 Tax=Opisthorchis felineus TaxID=147828 RepID=A0A4S2KX00_OPIFE|nr:hypothetical protein CRM22_010590 [Opisthorchis felineus]